MNKFDVVTAGRVYGFWMRCKKCGIDKRMREEMVRHVVEKAKKGEYITININGYKVHEINTVISVYKEIIFALNLERQVSILVTETPQYSDQDSLYAKKATNNALANIKSRYDKGINLLH